jgi:hypothetical protein
MLSSALFMNVIVALHFFCREFGILIYNLVPFPSKAYLQPLSAPLLFPPEL